MCLYPRLLLNKKYLNTKKNHGNPPPLKDIRLKYVAVGCGKCIECKKQKTREWQCRLYEELKVNKGVFITLSFSPESLKELSHKYNIKNVNDIAKKAVRLFLERHRKLHKKQLKHWLVTELGSEQQSGRIHLHGILFTEMNNAEIAELWKYGNTYTGTFCNIQTINYIVKYIGKIDFEHKNFEPVILCSKGIGRNYYNNVTKQYHKYKEKESKEFYRLTTGAKINLPIYYRNKFYTEEEREKLWLEKLDQNTRYVRGIKIDVSTKEGWESYERKLKQAQIDNENLGYGNDKTEWKKREYLITAKMLNKL